MRITRSSHHDRHGYCRRTSLFSSCWLGSTLRFVVLGALLLFQPAGGELQDFDLILEPTSASIHYIDFYLRGPGIINLGGLNVTAVSEAHGKTTYEAQDDDDDYEGEDDDHAVDLPDDDVLDDDEDNDDIDDDEGDDDLDDDDKDEDDDGKDDDGRRALLLGGQRSKRRNRNRRRSLFNWNKNAVTSRQTAAADGASSSSTFVDIIALRLPSNCANSRKGCDWTELGVGAKHSDGTLRWCCSVDAAALNMCTGGQNLGRLIVDPKKLDATGSGINRRSVEIQNKGNVSVFVENGKIQEKDSGRYVVIMANCNENGRNVLVSGTAAWKSVHGYLPGELYGFMFFYAVLTIIYFVLVLWYGISMHLNEESRIPIEHWILATIVLGLIEMLFKLGDVFVWNEDGYQEMWIAFIGIIMGVLKRGLSRCLIVMVALGWGVTRNDLRRKLKWIVISGIVFVGVSIARDIMLLIAVEEVQELSERVEADLFDIYAGLTFLVALIDVMFIMWILDGLSSTMEYLESINQKRKLQRYLSLRCLFLFSILFATIWGIFSLATSYADGIMREEDVWIVDGAAELNYLIVLTGVAFMWRPNPSAKDYAYAMELRAMSSDGDDDDGLTELELTGTIPSALDDDDDDYDGVTPPGYATVGSKKNGYHDG